MIGRLAEIHRLPQSGRSECVNVPRSNFKHLGIGMDCLLEVADDMSDLNNDTFRLRLHRENRGDNLGASGLGVTAAGTRPKTFKASPACVAQTRLSNHSSPSNRQK